MFQSNLSKVSVVPTKEMWRPNSKQTKMAAWIAVEIGSAKRCHAVVHRIVLGGLTVCARRSAKEA